MRTSSSDGLSNCLTAHRPYAEPEAAAERLLEIAKQIEPAVKGRIYIELINGPFLFRDRGTPAEYGAGLKLLVERRELMMHDSERSCGCPMRSQRARRIGRRRRPLNICCLPISVDTTANSHRSVIRLPAAGALSWTRDEGVLRMSIPSIVPNDRLDKDFYLVLEDFRAGPSSGKPTRASPTSS